MKPSESKRITEIVVLLGLALPASALARTKHRAKTVESYSAVEDDNSDVAGTPPAFEAVPVTVKPLKSPGFDPVPANQAAAILERLRLTQELLDRYGRAYDYRALTVKQLQAVLKELENAKRSSDRIAEPNSPDLREERIRENLRRESSSEPKALPPPVELEEKSLPDDDSDSNPGF